MEAAVNNAIIYIVLVMLLLILFCYRFALPEKVQEKFIVKIIITGIIFFGLYLYYTSINAADSNAYINEFRNSARLVQQLRGNWISYEIMNIIKKYTNNYMLFRMCVGIVYFIPIVIIVLGKYRDSINKWYFLLILTIYPFFISIVTLRNTLAASVCVLAYYYYFESDKRIKNFLIAIFIFGIAIGLHTTSFFQLIFFAIYAFYRKVTQKRLLVLFFLLIDFGAIFVIKSNLITQWLFEHVGESYQLFIHQVENVGYGFLLYVMVQLVYYFSLKQIRPYVMEKNSIYEEIYYLNNVLLLIFPLYAIDIIFFRLYRNVMILNALCYARNAKIRKKSCLNLVIIFMQVVLFYYGEYSILFTIL